MYAIYWKTPEGRNEMLVDAVNLRELAEVLSNMRTEFPGAYATRIL